MVCILAVYPNRTGSRFDVEYYRSRHASLAWRLLGPRGLMGLRISEGLASLDGSPPAFWMTTEMRFTSRDAFDSAMAESGAALFADAPNYTDVEPILQVCADGVDLASPTLMETHDDA